MSLVRVILGSKSDLAHGENIKSFLDRFGIDYDFHISSAHRKPDATAKLAKNAEQEGVEVIIAVAGMAAHLPGVVASHTTLPVIGVPLSGSALAGIDALYAVVQMPTGVPVACVAVDGSKNAVILAAQILGIKHPEIKRALTAYKQSLAKV
ncbi:MAG: 5-(carboxyamino)imidazole ribonucleotide mutase [Candidatus Cloacimonetes bacterium]|nr:5-(carboxyamino)imidazole ribonucleotide mutase [Candidatus Cloacimonadota bacterium]